MNRAGESQQKTPTRRLFFALWPEHAQQSALAEAAREAVQACKGRPVPVENFHLTLAFLGSVPEKRIGDLEGIAGRVAEDFVGKTPRVALDTVEYWKKAELLCAIARTGATQGPTEVASALAEALKAHLAGSGFAPDVKPFRAHVTLARNVPRRIPTADFSPIYWSFRAFALVESRTKSSGSEYTVLKSFRL